MINEELVTHIKDGKRKLYFAIGQSISLRHYRRQVLKIVEAAKYLHVAARFKLQTDQHTIQ